MKSPVYLFPHARGTAAVDEPHADRVTYLMSRTEQRARKRRAIKAAQERETAERTARIQAGEVTRGLDGGAYARFSEIRLMERAVRKAWVDDEKAIAVVDAMADVALLSSARLCDRVAAARVVIAAGAVDVRREGLEKGNRLPTVVNVFDRAQVLLQQLAQSPPAGPPDSPVAFLPRTAD